MSPTLSKTMAVSLALSLCLSLSVSAVAKESSPRKIAPENPKTIAATTGVVTNQENTIEAESLQEPTLEPMELAPQIAPQLPSEPPALSPAQPSATEPLKARAVVVDINSDTLNYDKVNDVYIATGSAHVVISEQNSELFADKITYDQKTGMMIAEGHVKIIKNGQKTDGAYAKIDLTRESALINDPITTIRAVRVKAEKAFVNAKYVELENGKFIISGEAMMRFQQQGGFNTFAQSTGKKASQARLNRAYYKEITKNQADWSSLMNDQQLYQSGFAKPMSTETLNFNDDQASTSRFHLHAKEIEVKRGEDGYDEINLKWPSLYLGRFKIATMPENEFSYEENAKQLTYLGPDIGSNRFYGGMYLGPGWDFHLGRGSLRVSPVISLGNPGFQTNNGKDGKNSGFGPGIGGMLHFRDPDTTMDLSYNSRVGTPLFFMDRRLIGENIHLMATHNDFYQNGLFGQTERPNYIAQLTDYRVLKQYKNFLVTSFESLGYARDNFNPNGNSTYFVTPSFPDPKSAGRVQLQAQLQNVRPLLKVGRHLSFGLRGSVALSGYSTGDHLSILRAGPTMNITFPRLQTQIGYSSVYSNGASPFVFDAYYGGSQNMTINNMLRITNFLSVGSYNNLNLKRENATNSLFVGNQFFVMVGPKDVKMNIGYDFISKRSSFSINYYPGSKNSIVNFDRLKLYQPENYSGIAPPVTVLK